MSKPSGGLYLWRTRKPSSFLGLSLKWMLLAGALIALGSLAAGRGWWSLLALLTLMFSGRHNAYAGLTNSFYFRGQQHLRGSYVYGKGPAAWSDLDPKCYRIPLPDAITHKGRIFRGRWTLETLEAALIKLTFPVYNVEKQPAWNMRKIDRRAAERQRWARDKSPLRVNVGRVAARWALMLVLVAGGAWTAWEAWV